MIPAIPPIPMLHARRTSAAASPPSEAARAASSSLRASSAYSGAGMSQWYDWLKAELALYVAIA